MEWWNELEAEGEEMACKNEFMSFVRLFRTVSSSDRIWEIVLDSVFCIEEDVLLWVGGSCPRSLLVSPIMAMVEFPRML